MCLGIELRPLSAEPTILGTTFAHVAQNLNWKGYLIFGMMMCYRYSYHLAKFKKNSWKGIFLFEVLYDFQAVFYKHHRGKKCHIFCNYVIKASVNVIWIGKNVISHISQNKVERSYILCLFQPVLHTHDFCPKYAFTAFFDAS